MGAKKVTKKNLKAVLAKLADMADTNKDDAIIICGAVNSMLDDLISDDFFGTEGQLDPRGDHRDE